MKKISNWWREDGLTIGFVPTMGALHEGHLSLVNTAKENSDRVIMSIFVNPTQFGPNEDFKNYPRTSEVDTELAINAGVDILFCPQVVEIYPLGFQTSVSVSEISTGLCGEFRPGHFQGVATVVLKLFNIVNPNVAVFGEKDFQQLSVIKKMARDLNLDVNVIGSPTIRESDGLAKSSRNKYLSKEERGAATIIFRALSKAEVMVKNGETNAERILTEVRELVESEPLCRLQYATICSNDTLKELDIISEPCRIAIALFCGKTRLIDNLELDPNRNEKAL